MIIIEYTCLIPVFSIGGFRLNKSSLRPQVFTLPDCQKCDILKDWLKKRAIEYNEQVFDTETQVAFIMRNVFGNPPILKLGESKITSEELFTNEVLDEKKLKEFLENAKA